MDLTVAGRVTAQSESVLAKHITGVVTQFADNLVNIISWCQLISSNPIHTNTTPEHYTLVYQHFSMTCFGQSFDHHRVEDKVCKGNVCH